MFSNDLLTSAELPMAAIPITAGAFTKQKITIGPIDIPAPGYVYIYVNDNSNSPNWAHFDDLKITHVHSPFVSGADYYPFGLTMSDREILTEPYRFGYQGQYAEEETETGWNSFDLRMYDARFGRWLSPDPYGQYASPYLAMGNNPISQVDPDGGFSGCPACDDALKQFGALADQFAVTVTRWIPTLTDVATTAVGAIAAQTAGFTADNRHWQKYGQAIEPSYSPTQAQLDRWNRKDNWTPSINLSSIPSPSISITTTIQDVAGYASLIPGVNTVAGVIEAGAAIYNGDYLGAGLAVAGAVPVLGSGLKWGRMLIQAHHVIPNAVIKQYSLKLISGFTSNGLRNIKRIPFPFHGNHPAYSNYVRKELNNIRDSFNGTIPIDEIHKLQNQLKKEIRNAWRIHKQGGGNLNDYFRNK